MSIFDDALRTPTAGSLMARSQAVQAVQLGEVVETSFSLSQIREGVCEASIKTWLSEKIWPYQKKQPALYDITANDDHTASLIVGAFPRNPDRGFDGPKVNKGTEGSTTLYVGSSEDIQKRLREHLWTTRSGSTYAMHLSRWCPSGEGSVRVRVQAILHNESRDLRQDLEDAVWHQFKPRLGKPGGR
jgi:hypothetical protein